MVSSSHRCDLLRRFEAAAYQVANEPETMEESDEEDSAHVGVGNIFKDESFLSELEQTENFIKGNMEIDSDGDMITLKVVKMGIKEMAREKDECTELYFLPSLK